MLSHSEPEERKDIIKGIDIKKFFDLALKNFIEGYISIYSKNLRNKAIDNIINIFESKEEFLWQQIPDDELKNIRKNIIMPIIDRIKLDKNFSSSR